MTHQRLLLVGGGRMGSALLSGWRESAHPLFVTHGIELIEPNAPSAQRLSGMFPTVTVHAGLDELSHRPDIVLLAVKPQSLPEVMAEYAEEFGSKPLYISIAAGKGVPFYESYLGGRARIIRAMPNTPAQIRQGTSVCYASGACSKDDKALAASLLEAAGTVEWVDDEGLMHVVTALSGSGPAYVFLFMEALIDAGIAHGLPETLSRALTIRTVEGAAALAAVSDQDLAMLRQEVTSPNGTTEAGLRPLLQSDALRALMHSAIQAATRRSEELAK